MWLSLVLKVFHSFQSILEEKELTPEELLALSGECAVGQMYRVQGAGRWVCHESGVHGAWRSVCHESGGWEVGVS